MLFVKFFSGVDWVAVFLATQHSLKFVGLRKSLTPTYELLTNSKAKIISQLERSIKVARNDPCLFGSGKSKGMLARK
jgi:hypothetical protein